MIQSGVDSTVYTGITQDVEKRVGEHNEGKGAKYTRRNAGSWVLKFSLPIGSRSSALKIEYRIKQFRKDRKMRIILEQSLDTLYWN